MPPINPFRIAVPDADLADLKYRLARTRWPEAECVDDWTQGIPLSYTRELAEYWAAEYDWRAREAALNRFDQFTTDMENPTEEEAAALERVGYYRKWDHAYAKQPSTRPQTIGYALVDSPVGQLAWIVEKFWSWTDCDGHPENVLTRDELLDNVMLYWLTASGASSARLYWESFRVFGDGQRKRVELPTGVASFPKEILRTPRNWCEAGYNITHWTNMPRGGHFAAFEQPELFVGDVREFFSTVR